MTDTSIKLCLAVLIALLNTMFWSLFAPEFFLPLVFMGTSVLCMMVIRLEQDQQ